MNKESRHIRSREMAVRTTPVEDVIFEGDDHVQSKMTFSRRILEQMI
jgi:hypothetical protein